MADTLSATRIAELAYQAGFRGRSIETAVAVALAESAGDPTARGDTGLQNGTWGPSVGLWQIRSLNDERGTGGTRDEKANLDPRTNARHAYTISGKGTNWQPWAAYTNGSYRQFLGRAHEAAARVRRDPPSHPRRHGRPGGRIVLDLPELSRLSSLMGTSRDRVEHSHRVVRTVSADVTAAGAVPPGRSTLIAALTGALEGPTGLPLLAARLDRMERLVRRTHQLAADADGPGGRAADVVAFVRTTGGTLDLAESAVLEALVAGGLRTRRHAAHPSVPPAHGGRPAHPGPPPRQPMNGGNPVPESLRRFRNGNLPASRLRPVGEGERLAAPAAKAFRRMDQAARADGINLRVESGYRSYAEQAELYRRYQNGTGNLAAPPGQSNHGWGLSADLRVAGDPRTLEWLRDNASRYGFFNDVSSESWHWTYRPR
jgi:hypothetical protein